MNLLFKMSGQIELKPLYRAIYSRTNILVDYKNEVGWPGL